MVLCGWQHHCCSVAYRVIKQKIITDHLSEMSIFFFVSVHVAPHE